MNNVVLSTRNIDDFISDVANEVVKRMEAWNVKPPQVTDQSDKLLTIQEASEFISLSVPTIYSKVSKGELPVMKRSKRLYFSRSELIEYIRQGRRKTTSEIESETLTDMMKTKKRAGHGK